MAHRSRSLTGLLHWQRVDDLVKQVKAMGPWYVHSPEQGNDSLMVLQGNQAGDFLAQRAEDIKTRRCGAGWIYVHTPKNPSWIKIYDPLKCGSSCSTTAPDAWWEMELNDPRK
jgi:hypothetical protein